jgi:hypothetical protein
MASLAVLDTSPRVKSWVIFKRSGSRRTDQDTVDRSAHRGLGQMGVRHAATDGMNEICCGRIAGGAVELPDHYLCLQEPKRALR